MDGLDALQDFRDRGAVEVVPVEETDLFVEFRRVVDDGMAAVLTCAIVTDAELVLLDERETRSMAKPHGLSVTGVVGVLLRGSARGVIDPESELGALRSDGFWISDELYETALGRDSATG